MNKPPILLIGEAPGELEARSGFAFVGGSGAELLKMLGQAGVIHLDNRDQRLLSLYYSTQKPEHTNAIWERHADAIHRTNVFSQHPPRNDLGWFCGPKSTAIAGYPQLSSSKWVREEFEPELDRLADEILNVNPNLVVCLGNTPLWALTGRTRITKWRGATQVSTHCVADYKLLPTYHPAAVLYQWSIRPTVIADLIKARREAELGPELWRPAREIWIEPTIEDVNAFIQAHIRGCKFLSVDIETSGQRITCIGFAPTSELAIVIPFDDERRKNGSYWESPELERKCWRLVMGVLQDPTIPKLFHNGLYDIAFLWRSMRIAVRGAIHDTMLLMHSLQPESMNGQEGHKNLGYVGSVYANECAWKNLGAHSKTIKRED